jgi:uncharacterized protein (TIGR02001 family)
MTFALAILASAAPVIAAESSATSPQLSNSSDLQLIGDMQVAAPAVFTVPTLIRVGQKTAKPVSGLDDENDASGITFSPSVTLVSDYRFRGISLSGKDPAIQGGLEASANGFYAGVWASNIALYAGTHVELDVYGGWRGEVAGLNLDVGATNYLYPGGTGGKYSEFAGSVGKTIGPLDMKVGIAYAPAQKNIGSDNFYAYGQARAGIPGTPVTLSANLGHESGSLAGPNGKKWDWSVGGEAVFKKFTLGLKYVDTNINRAIDPGKTAQSGVVVSLGWAF